MLVLVERGIPLPTQQLKVKLGAGKYRLDFAWPDKRVFLEGDSFGWHNLSTDLENDARRQNALVIDGWRPLRITFHMSDDEIGSNIAALVM
jgi:very-short-patch-repair endonuclease